MYISTRLVDCTHGVPAAGVGVRLDRLDLGDTWSISASGQTGRDGRFVERSTEDADRLPSDRYRLVYDTGSYFAALGIVACQPEVVIVFAVSAAGSRFHVEVMASAAGYGAYCSRE